MTEHIKVAYENIGSSSYLTVTFGPEAGLIEYQLGMITSNEICHLLASTKRTIDGATVAYYNISSRVTLSQVLERRKLKREEFLNLIDGVIRATKEIGEYQLTASGLVMDPDYIYVDPAGCTPYFVYLPTAEYGEKGIRDFLVDLVMKGQIEMSQDNFVQVLLEAVNSQPFSAERLETCVKAFRGVVSKSAAGGVVNRNGFGKVSGDDHRGLSSVAYGGVNGGDRGGLPNHGHGGSLEGGQGDFNGIRGRSQPEVCGTSGNSAPVGKTGMVPKQTGERKKNNTLKQVTQEDRRTETDETAEEDSFDAEKAKKKFILPQAMVMVIVSALISFGAFTDGTGAIIINNVLAVVILMVLFEVILYREIYINSRKRGRNNKKAGKAGTRPRPLAPGSRSEAEKPANGKTITVKPGGPVSRGDFGDQEGERAGSGSDQVALRNDDCAGRYAASLSDVNFSCIGYTTGTDQGGETEIFDGAQSAAQAYLEYYSNGILTRVPLDKPSFMVGRLQSQVDFAVPNPKVGKVHVQFLNQGGRIYVKDLNSKNGTYLNGSGQRINSNVPYPLNDQDRITLADSEFTLRCPAG